MINDDQHDEHDEHDDDHTMMMSCMTCIPIPCTMHGANACHKATRNAQTHKRIKMHKNKRNVTKTCKKIQRHETTMAFKKTMVTKRGEHKGGPTGVRDPLKWDPHHKTRQGT